MSTTLERSELITERQAISGRVDRENGIIRGVKILGRISRNGREYTEAAMRNAKSLYEGAKVNVNHPAKGKESAPRDYQDRLGLLRNVELRADGLYGDLHYNPHHSVAEQLAYDAQHSPESAGLSHNIEGRTSKQGGKTIVEEILRVQSVDLVADPATTRGLYEGTGSADAGVGDTRSLLEQMRGQRPLSDESKSDFLHELTGRRPRLAAKAQTSLEARSDTEARKSSADFAKRMRQ